MVQSCASTIRELLEKSGIAAKDVASIGVTARWQAYGIDENGKASTYYDSWLDTRRQYAEEMRFRAEA